MEFLKLFLNGEKGISLKKILEIFSMNIDLKLAFIIIEFFKKNCFFFAFLLKNTNNPYFFCYWEYKRMEILKNSLGKPLFFTEISNQILREIGKKKAGIFQYRLAKKLNLKSNYIHHVLGKLISLNLIKKYVCFLKINSKISNIILLKGSLDFFWSNECRCKNLEEKNSNENIEKMEIIFIIKTLCRKLKNIWTEKDIKYGVTYLKKIPNKIDKRRIHRKWQKIRKKCKKSGLFIFRNNLKNQPKKTTKTLPKGSEICQKTNLWIHTSSKIQTSQLKTLFFFSLSTLIRKTFFFLTNAPISCCKFLEKFKGYFSYQNIYSVLLIFNKFRGVDKTLEQLGRQKILHFKKNFIQHKNNNNLINSEKILRIKKGITEQTLKRKLTLLSFIKNNFISLKEIGQFIALQEKKGLKKIDSKVIRRFLSDLIGLNLLKIIKIHIQISFKKFKKFEFVINPDLEKEQTKKIFKLLSISIPKNKKNQQTKKVRSNLLIEIVKKKKKSFFLSFLFKKLFKKNPKEKNNFFVSLFKKVYLEKNLKKLNLFQKMNREFSGKNSFFFNFRIFLKKLNNKNLQYPNLLLNNINFFLKEKNATQKKKFIFKKQKSHLNSSEKFLFNFGLSFQKFSFFQKFSNTESSPQDTDVPNLFFKKNLKALKIQNSNRKNFIPGKKWDCDMDISLFSKFLNIKLNTGSQKNNEFLKIKIFNRRFKTISSCTNLKYLKIFFKKGLNLRVSQFLERNFLNFYFHIKRAFELCSFFYGFNFHFFWSFLFKKLPLFFLINQKKIKIEILKKEKYFEKYFNQNFFFFIFGLGKKLNQINILKRNYFFENYFLNFKEKKLIYDLKIFKEKNFDVENIFNFSILKKNKIKRKKILQKISFPCEKTSSFEKLREIFFFLNFDQNFIIFVPFFLKFFFEKKKFQTFFPLKFFKKETTPNLKKNPGVEQFIEVRIFSFLSNFSNKEKNTQFFKFLNKKTLVKNSLMEKNLFRIKIKNFFNSENKIKNFLDFLFRLNSPKKHKSFASIFNKFIWFENCLKKKFFQNFLTLIKINKSIKERKICRYTYFKKLEYFILIKIIKNPFIEFEKIIHSPENNFFLKKTFYQALEKIFCDGKIEKKFLILKFNGYCLIRFQFFSYEKNFINQKSFKSPFFLFNCSETFR